MGKSAFEPIISGLRRPMSPSHRVDPSLSSISSSAVLFRFPMRQKPGRDRLDRALVLRGFAESREQAGRLILSGPVLVDGIPAVKQARLVSPEPQIELA